MRRIFLIGYMGAGKTSIGKRLANRLDLSLVDMDVFIENRYRKKIADIFAKEGENRFREMEQTVLQEIIHWEDVVVSTGGGTPCFFNNMELMNTSGTTVYLKTPIEILAARLDKIKYARPLVEDKNLEEIKQFVTDSLAKREPFYSKASIIYPVRELEINTIVENLIQKI